MMKLIQILMILPIVVYSINAKEKGYFDLHEKGWHWYREVPGTKKDESELNKENFDIAFKV